MANHLSHFHHHHLLLLLLLVPHTNAEKCKVDSYEGKVRVFGTQGSVACLCEGGEARSYFDFTSPAGLSVSCRVGEACTPGMDQTQTSNATDASCGPLARCTDDTSTPYKGCIPSKCTIDRSTPYQGCILSPCSNTDATVPNDLPCSCPRAIETSSCKSGEYCRADVENSNPDGHTSCSAPCINNGNGYKNKQKCMCVGVTDISKLDQCGTRIVHPDLDNSDDVQWKRYWVCNDGTCSTDDEDDPPAFDLGIFFLSVSNSYFFLKSLYYKFVKRY